MDEHTQSRASEADRLPEGRWAISHVPSHLRLWIVTILGLTADLWTKHWAFSTLSPNDPRPVIEHLCSLQRSLNPGALFGLGAGFAPVFVGASVLALLFVLYLFANTGASRWLMHLALGLVLAGALGNLYDRATQEAYVVHMPNGGRFIGKLLEETDAQVVLTDFPDGGAAQKRVFARGKLPGSGLQPVVRDFVLIEAQAGGLKLWPWVFNVADVLLVIGVAGLLIGFWRERKHLPHAAVPEQSADAKE